MAKREDKGTTMVGHINKNGQKNLGRVEPPQAGTDLGQYVFVMNCVRCGTIYGSNGSDIFERKCPNCQGGEKGPKLLIIEDK
jgi:PHP family Zn ribbon phosphoesterase